MRVLFSGQLLHFTNSKETNFLILSHLQKELLKDFDFHKNFNFTSASKNFQLNIHFKLHFTLHLVNFYQIQNHLKNYLNISMKWFNLLLFLHCTNCWTHPSWSLHHSQNLNQILKNLVGSESIASFHLYHLFLQRLKSLYYLYLNHQKPLD